MSNNDHLLYGPVPGGDGTEQFWLKELVFADGKLKRIEWTNTKGDAMIVDNVTRKYVSKLDRRLWP